MTVRRASTVSNFQDYCYTLVTVPWFPYKGLLFIVTFHWKHVIGFPEKFNASKQKTRKKKKACAHMSKKLSNEVYPKCNSQLFKIHRKQKGCSFSTKFLFHEIISKIVFVTVVQPTGTACGAKKESAYSISNLENRYAAFVENGLWLLHSLKF